MSAWGNLQDQCEECKQKFMKNKLVEFEGKKYCEECYNEMQEKQTKTCSRCKNDFEQSDMETYYGKWYCIHCKKLEQEERRREKEEDHLLDEIVKDDVSNDELIELKEEISWIKQMILNITQRQDIIPSPSQEGDKKVFDYITDEPEFWKWLEDQDGTNRAVKRFVTHGRKSPIDDGIKIFIKFLKDNGYTI